MLIDVTRNYGHWYRMTDVYGAQRMLFRLLAVGTYRARPTDAMRTFEDHLASPSDRHAFQKTTGQLDGAKKSFSCRTAHEL